MTTLSNGNIFCVIGPLWGESSGHRSIPHNGRWRGALRFSLICVWTNVWANKRDAGDLRCHYAHYAVTVTNTNSDWSSFGRQHIQTDILEWILFYFDWNITQVFSWGPIHFEPILVKIRAARVRVLAVIGFCTFRTRNSLALMSFKVIALMRMCLNIYILYMCVCMCVCVCV